MVLTTRQMTLQKSLEPRQLWEMGPHLDQDCLAMHTSCPPFQLRLHVRSLKLNLGKWGFPLDPTICFSSQCAHVEYISFSAFHCHLSLPRGWFYPWWVGSLRQSFTVSFLVLLRNWLTLSCYGCQGLGFDPNGFCNRHDLSTPFLLAFSPGCCYH